MAKTQKKDLQLQILSESFFNFSDYFAASVLGSPTLPQLGHA